MFFSHAGCRVEDGDTQRLRGRDGPRHPELHALTGFERLDSSGQRRRTDVDVLPSGCERKPNPPPGRTTSLCRSAPHSPFPCQPQKAPCSRVWRARRSLDRSSSACTSVGSHGHRNGQDTPRVQSSRRAWSCSCAGSSRSAPCSSCRPCGPGTPRRCRCTSSRCAHRWACSSRLLERSPPAAHADPVLPRGRRTPRWASQCYCDLPHITKWSRWDTNRDSPVNWANAEVDRPTHISTRKPAFPITQEVRRLFRSLVVGHHPMAIAVPTQLVAPSPHPPAALSHKTFRSEGRGTHLP